MSAYLNEPNRLADVIAAIQAMGTYKLYSRPGAEADSVFAWALVA